MKIVLPPLVKSAFLLQFHGISCTFTRSITSMWTTAKGSHLNHYSMPQGPSIWKKSSQALLDENKNVYCTVSSNPSTPAENRVFSSKLIQITFVIWILLNYLFEVYSNHLSIPHENWEGATRKPTVGSQAKKSCSSKKTEDTILN